MEKLSGDRLGEWLRRRLFELRVRDVGMGASELLTILQSLSDEQFAPPFAEVKMWLGLDTEEELQPSLAQLLQEFVAIRVAGSSA